MIQTLHKNREQKERKEKPLKIGNKTTTLKKKKK